MQGHLFPKSAPRKGSCNLMQTRPWDDPLQSMGTKSSPFKIGIVLLCYKVCQSHSLSWNAGDAVCLDNPSSFLRSAGMKYAYPFIHDQWSWNPICAFWTGKLAFFCRYTAKLQSVRRKACINHCNVISSFRMQRLKIVLVQQWHTCQPWSWSALFSTGQSSIAIISGIFCMWK